MNPIEKLQVNDFGRFRFPVNKKIKKGEFNVYINAVATVIEMDNKFIQLRDNDDFEYLLKISDIKAFERLERVDN